VSGLVLNNDIEANSKYSHGRYQFRAVALPVMFNHCLLSV